MLSIPVTYWQNATVNMPKAMLRKMNENEANSIIASIKLAINEI
jgi:hypothetical protein